MSHILKESVLYNHKTELKFSSVFLIKCWYNEVKVKLFICLIKYHAVMRLHYVLTSALAGGEWSTSSHTKLYTRDKVPSAQGIEGCWASRHIFKKQHTTTFFQITPN